MNTRGDKVHSVIFHYSLEDLTLELQDSVEDSKNLAETKDPCPERLVKDLLEYKGDNHELLYFSVCLLYQKYFKWDDLFHKVANHLLEEVSRQRAGIRVTTRSMIPNCELVIPDCEMVIPNCEMVIPDRKMVIPNRKMVIPDHGLAASGQDQGLAASDPGSTVSAALSFLQVWKREFPADFEDEQRKMYWKRLFLQIERDSFEGKPEIKSVQSTRLPKSNSTDIISLRGFLSSIQKLFLSLSDLKLTGSVLDIPPDQLAFQITAHHRHLFRALCPSEFAHLAWTHPTRHRQAPNLRRLIAWSDHLSWSLIQVILQSDHPKQRAAILRYSLKLAHQLLQLGDYNGLKCVVVAMGYSAIRRLRKTWRYFTRREKRTFRELEELVGEDHNWINLRRLENTGECIPFLGLHLTDLVHLYERIPKCNPIASGHFEAWMSYAQKVKILLKMGGTLVVESIDIPNDGKEGHGILMIEKIEIQNEQDLLKRSLQIEPRSVMLGTTTKV